MNQLEVFNKFAKANKNRALQRVTTNVVVYTRVSTKEQADNNYSLATQRKVIEEYVEKHHLNIVGFFGGTYESAKTDGRKEFLRMLEFIKQSKNKISQLLVYSLDRFSRTGGAAIKLATDLREKYGVNVFAVTQPTDTSNPSGVLHQNIQLLFSEFDNQLRKQKAVAGMKEKFKQGIWVVRVPPGYDIVKSKGERKIVLNDEGKKLKKAFEWKLQGVKNEEIVARMKAMGVNMYPQKLCKIFINPFYCGILSHKMLEGKVVEGKHEKLITKEVFLKINNLLKESRYGIPHEKENNNLSLKTFMKCSGCGTSLTGYLVKKKNLYYYKCPTKGCNSSKNAKQLDQLFQEKMQTYSLEEKNIDPILYNFEYVLQKNNQQAEQLASELKTRLTEINKKIENIEDKYFALNEMPEETYKRLIEKYKEEKQETLKELENCALNSSNLLQQLKTVLTYLSNPAKMWALAGAKLREKLQKVVFPIGMVFDKEKNAVLTERVNDVYRQLALLSGGLGCLGGGNSPFLECASLCAEREGFEPPGLLHPPVFKTGAINHSAISPVQK